MHPKHGIKYCIADFHMWCIFPCKWSPFLKCNLCCVQHLWIIIFNAISQMSSIIYNNYYKQGCWTNYYKWGKMCDCHVQLNHVQYLFSIITCNGVRITRNYIVSFLCQQIQSTLKCLDFVTYCQINHLLDLFLLPYSVDRGPTKFKYN